MGIEDEPVAPEAVDRRVFVRVGEGGRDEGREDAGDDVIEDARLPARPWCP